MNTIIGGGGGGGCVGGGGARVKLDKLGGAHVLKV